jgi:hypothetical protein
VFTIATSPVPVLCSSWTFALQVGGTQTLTRNWRPESEWLHPLFNFLTYCFIYATPTHQGFGPFLNARCTTKYGSRRPRTTTRRVLINLIFFSACVWPCLVAACAVHAALCGLHTPGAGCTEECSSAHSAKHPRMYLYEKETQLRAAAAAALPSTLHSRTEHVNNSRRPRTTTGRVENICSLL